MPEINWVLNTRVIGEAADIGIQAMEADACGQIRVVVAGEDNTTTSTVRVEAPSGGSGQIQFLLIASHVHEPTN